MAMEWVFGAPFQELVTFKCQPGDFARRKRDDDLCKTSQISTLIYQVASGKLRTLSRL